ncbi:MAG: hypothetical protein ACKVUS_01670 [Saprospiraceae bacterium]
MIRLLILLLLSNGASVKAQKEQCVMPQGWYGITPFGWKPGNLADSSMSQIEAIRIRLDIHHSWNFGSEGYGIEYGRRDSFFEIRTARYEDKLTIHVLHKNREWEEPINPDSAFKQRFEAERLFQLLRSIQQPSPFWNEKDFDWPSKFQTDLTQLPRNPMGGYRNCDDCSSYDLEIQFLIGEKTISAIALRFDSGFRLPRTEDTAMKQFKVRSMLEWMYLYQLCHLFFPENVALNKSHFQEKKIGELADWSRQKFPELNK